MLTNRADRRRRPGHPLALVLWAVVVVIGVAGCVGDPPPPHLPDGAYYGHNRTLVADDADHAVYTFRPDAPCPAASPTDACDTGRPEESARAVVILLPEGPRLVAVVTETNEPVAAPRGARLPVEQPRPGVVVLGSGDAAVGFCADGIADESCGA